jgi:hypothetical protein
VSYTKRQLIESALGELGLASYTFDLMPEQIDSALRRMDSMLAEWNAKGIRLGYSIPDSPELSDVEADSGLSDSAWEAVITNLAIRVAPGFGKAIHPATAATARAAYNTLLARAAFPSKMKLPSMPSGSGNKSFDEPFTGAPEEDLVVGPDGSLDFN